jgi:undecaprenyl-diphosphatase
VSYTQAVFLGIVQGLTEFLPISSSGHLILVPHVFGWPDQGLAFDAVMHLGTIAALLAYFRGELLALLTGEMSRRLAMIIVAATIPAGLAGLLLGDVVETSLRSTAVIAASTAFWACVMWIADRHARVAGRMDGVDPLERVNFRQGIGVGVAQAIALVPGTSRSGITITTGLFAGLDRATAARFSFLLGIPVTAAAGALEMLRVLRDGLPAGDTGPLVAALVAAFASGWFAVWFLVNYLKRRSLLPFVIYRLALAAVILAVLR